MKLALVLVALLIPVLNFATAAEPIAGDAAPAFTTKDTHGVDISLTNYTGKLVVLEWTNPDCPFVKKHYGSGNMQALQSNYTGKGVIWLTICSSADGKQGHYSAAEWNSKLIPDRGMASTAVVLDGDGTIGHAYGARNTPFMVVIGKDGKIVYLGGIDNKPSTEVADIKGAVNYVAAALDATLAGKPVTTPTAKPYGCGVKY